MIAEDLDRVCELENACFTSAWSRESIEFELTQNAFCRPFVLEEDGRIEGFAFLWVMFEQAQLADIGIDPDARRKGYGHQMMDALIAQAREEECEILTLEVRPSNTAAKTLYERHGFTPLRRVKSYYSDGEDAEVMGLGL